MSWIKMRTDLLEDPDVVSISTAVGMDEYSVVGRLLKLWGWVSQHTTDGRNVRVTDQFLDRFINCSGFCSALRTCNWLSGSDLALTFPKFDRHNSNTAKARALEAEAKKIRRDDSDVGQMSDKKELKCPTRYNSSLISSSGYSSEGVPRGNHSPPTLEMVVKACHGAGSSTPIPKSEGEAFWHHYEAIGWVTGNNIPIRNWEAKLREWHTEQVSKDAEKKAKSNGFHKPMVQPAKLPSQFVKRTPEEDAIGTIQGLMAERGELSNGQKSVAKAAFERLKTIPKEIQPFCKKLGLLP